jgi:DNA-directed RNA polymerase subunit RPC12/RpoP
VRSFYNNQTNPKEEKLAKQKIVDLTVVCPSCKIKNLVKMDMNAPDTEMLIDHSMVECRRCGHKFLLRGNIEDSRIKTPKEVTFF